MCDLFSVQGLLKKAISAAFDCFQRRMSRAAAGNYHHGYSGPRSPGDFDNGQTFGEIIDMRRQAQIAQHHINMFTFEQLRGFIARGRFQNAILLIQGPKKTAANCFVVINY